MKLFPCLSWYFQKPVHASDWWLAAWYSVKKSVLRLYPTTDRKIKNWNYRWILGCVWLLMAMEYFEINCSWHHFIRTEYNHSKHYTACLASSIVQAWWIPSVCAHARARVCVCACADLFKSCRVALLFSALNHHHRQSEKDNDDYFTFRTSLKTMIRTVVFIKNPDIMAALTPILVEGDARIVTERMR